MNKVVIWYIENVNLIFLFSYIKIALRNKDICSGVNIYRTFYKFEAPL